MSATMSRKVEGLEAHAKRRVKTPKGKGAKKGAKPKNAPGVVRGGDGGAAPTHEHGPHHRDNALVCLTNLDLLRADAAAFAAFADACVPTRDPDDTAHLHRKRFIGGGPGECVFLTNHEVRQLKLRTTPRRYHRSQMTSRGVGYDSMYDRAYRVGIALQDQGVELGWRPVVSGFSAPEHDRALALAGLDRDAARDRLRPRHRVRGETDAEKAAEHAGSEWLRRAGLDEDGNAPKTDGEDAVCCAR